jgi:pantetheine-phosphate adenylyltransferase
LPLFDKIIIAIGVNANKHSTYMFTLEERLEALRRCFAGEPRIAIDHYEGLTINYCQRVEAQYILRGLRIAADFEYERNIALMNRALVPEVETVFLISQPEYSAITSTVVRDILRNGGEVSAFVPKSFFSK